MLSKKREKRQFTVVDYPKKGEKFGIYNSFSPKAAANKAFTKLSKIIDLKNSNDKNFLIFTIQDINNKKYYPYIGSRILLDQPIYVKKNENLIICKYKNIIAKNRDYLFSSA